MARTAERAYGRGRVCSGHLDMRETGRDRGYGEVGWREGLSWGGGVGDVGVVVLVGLRVGLGGRGEGAGGEGCVCRVVGWIEEVCVGGWDRVVGSFAGEEGFYCWWVWLLVFGACINGCDDGMNGEEAGRSYHTINWPRREQCMSLLSTSGSRRSRLPNGTAPTFLPLGQLHI